MNKLFVTFLTICMMFSLGLQSQIIDEAPMDALYNEDEIIMSTTPIPLPSIRAADVMWSKRVWREVDFRQKFNQKFYFPLETQANWRSFIVVVLDITLSA